ncbi:MAG: subtype B tannase [Acidobacteriota bacterium]
MKKSQAIFTLLLGLAVVAAADRSVVGDADAASVIAKRANAPGSPAGVAPAARQGNPGLAFDEARCSVKTLTVGDLTIAYRAYENIVYAANPVDARYQSLSFFVPEAFYKGETVGGYNARTAPIFFPNSVGGYMPGLAGGPGQARDGRPNAAFMALSRGCVVAAPGTRGRTLRNANGMLTGKAPACIVDLKAAVRYLRHNDRIMPGDAEKIVSSGTSAGGALSALLGASGNAADYEPFLKEIGAAAERDDIFAASCYCPITNLDNADAAYEWLFYGVNDYSGRAKGSMSAAQIEISGRLRALFPEYVNGLGLKKADGSPLTLDASGGGSFKDHIKSLVMASAQDALNGGGDLSGLTWLTIRGATVADIDFDRFPRYATRMKTAPAFDALDLSSPENNLFGTATVDSRHFTRFGRDNSADRSLADAAVVKMMNPMSYIGAKGASTARHWRIRHGAVDRDTSLAIPVILAAKLRNEGFDVDFAIPWGQGHGGDYDLDRLFAWIDRICGPERSGR